MKYLYFRRVQTVRRERLFQRYDFGSSAKMRRRVVFGGLAWFFSGKVGGGYLRFFSSIQRLMNSVERCWWWFRSLPTKLLARWLSRDS